MARKRDSKPREPIPEKIPEPVLEILEVPDGPEEYQDVTDVIDNMFGPPPKKDNKQEKKSSHETQEEEKLAPVAGSVDDYIRHQVLREMYGTETPSEYDKIQLALKRLL